MQYAFSERVVRVVFQTCKRFYFSDATDRIFCYIGTFQPLFVGKASTLSTGLYSAPKSEKAEYLLADFSSPTWCRENFPRCKREKKHSRDFFCKAACYGRLHCFKAKAIRTDLLRNFGRSNKVQYTALGAAHPMCSFSRPEVPNSLLKKIELHQKKIIFYF